MNQINFHTMRSKNIIHKIFYYLIFILIFSCSDDKSNSTDVQSPTNRDSAKTTLRNSIPDSDTLTYVKPISEKKLMLRIDGELMDCEGSTIELSCCTAYIADSLNVVLNMFCDSLISDLNSKISSTQEYLTSNTDDDIIQELQFEISYHQHLKEDLISSQKYFFKYLKAQLKLVGTSHDGNGRILHQDRIEVELLEERVCDLKELFSGEINYHRN